MPLVKPDDTGRESIHHGGPMPVHPAARGEPPPSSAHKQAVDPVLGDNARTTTTNAPVVRQSVFLSAQRGDEKAGTIAQYSPLGRETDAMGNAIASAGDEAYGHAGDEVRHKFVAM